MSLEHSDALGMQGTEALSDFITLGSIMMKGRFVLALIVVGTLTLWLLGRTYLQQRNQWKMQSAVASILDVIQKMPKAQGDADSTQTRQVDFTPMMTFMERLESPLQCIDAKLLQLDREASQLKDQIARLDSEHALIGLDKLLQQVLMTCEKSQVDIEQWQNNVPPKIKEIYGFTCQVPAINKLVQSMGLDVAKQFAMAETMSDSLLKQQREALQLLQSDNKETHTKLAKAESALDELKAGQKQLSLDVHVSRTKGEQKLDSIAKDLASLAGSTSSSFRGLNVLVPQRKTTQDRLADISDYLVKNHQYNERQEADTRVLEAATNSEDRLVRLETSLLTLQETVTEVTEMMQQVRKCQSLIQDLCQTIIERTPKLPKRPPPATETPPPTSTTPPPQPQPQPQQVPNTPTPTVNLQQHMPPV